MMRKVTWFILPVLLLVVHLRTGFAQSSSRPEVLLAGDAVNIQIWQLFDNANSKSPMSNLSGEYVIDTKGYIFMPFVGLINVANQTPDKVGDLVKQKYMQFLNDPYIYVRPLIRVTLRGFVRKPGSYRVDPKNSFWDLMEIADGPLTEADLEKMYVVRGGNKVIKDLLQAFEKAHSLSEVGVISGDQIVIPPRGRSFGLGSIIRYSSMATSFALLYIRLVDKRR